MKPLFRLGLLLVLSLLLAGCGHHATNSSTTNSTSTSTAAHVTTTTSSTSSGQAQPPVMVAISGVVKPICPGAIPGLKATCYTTTKLVGKQATYTVSGHFHAEVLAGVYQTTTRTCRVSMPVSLTHPDSDLNLYGQCPADLPAAPGGAVSNQAHPGTGPAPKIPGHGGKPVGPIIHTPPTS